MMSLLHCNYCNQTVDTDYDVDHNCEEEFNQITKNEIIDEKIRDDHNRDLIDDEF